MLKAANHFVTQVATSHGNRQTKNVFARIQTREEGRKGVVYLVQQVAKVGYVKVLDYCDSGQPVPSLTPLSVKGSPILSQKWRNDPQPKFCPYNGAGRIPPNLPLEIFLGPH